MYKLLIYLVFLSFNVLSHCDDSILDDTELVLTFLVHRHGERTPVESLIGFSNDVEALTAATAAYGYGQLTDLGKRRGYELGQFIRRRYDSLLSPQYNKSEIYIRSTDSTRAKMTVLSAMAAVYPALEDNWSESINWTPVPYTTVPAKYDFNLATINCPAFTSVYTTLFMSSTPSMDKYTNILDTWSGVLGFNLTAMPAMAYSIYDLYTTQIGLGIPLDPTIQDILPEIEEVAAAAMDVVFANEDHLPLHAGVLLKTFFQVVDKFIAGEDVQRVQVYSAHDVNVYTFEGVTRATPRQGVPKYASAYALELRKVVNTGAYVVVSVYLKTPSEDVVTYLQIDGCDELCDIESFRNLTTNYILDEDDWRTQCNFSENDVFDTSSID